MKKIRVMMIALLVTGCAANSHGYQNTDQITAHIIGMPLAELVDKLGEPRDTLQYGEGAKSMSFRLKTKGLTGGECNITVVAQGGRVQSANVSAKGKSWLSDPLDSCLSLIQNLD